MAPGSLILADSPVNMPAFLHLLGRRNVTTTPYGDAIDSDAHGGSTIWIIPTVVAGGVVITALLVWALVGFSRRRQYRKAREKDLCLTQTEFVKRRKMSATKRLEEEERQRVIMIRKSLASRESGSLASQSRRTSAGSESSQLSQVDRVVAEEREDEAEPKALKEDWKSWEARMQRSVYPNQHPAADPVPDLAMPRPSRPHSPSHSPLLRPLSSAPELPRLPPGIPERDSP